MGFLCRLRLDFCQSILCCNGSFLRLASKRNGERYSPFTDHGTCKHVKCGIRAYAELLTKGIKLFFDVSVKAD